MKFMDKAEKVFQKILWAEKIIGALSLFVMLMICFGAVIMRYLFNDPLTWSEEVILILLVIFGYMCISIDIYNDEHIALTFLYDILPVWLQRVLDVFRHVIIGGFFLLMAQYGIQIFKIKAGKPLPATGWSQGIVFFAETAVSFLVVLFCLMNILRVIFKTSPTDQQRAKKKDEVSK